MFRSLPKHVNEYSLFTSSIEVFLVKKTTRFKEAPQDARNLPREKADTKQYLLKGYKYGVRVLHQRVILNQKRERIKGGNDISFFTALFPHIPVLPAPKRLSRGMTDTNSRHELTSQSDVATVTSDGLAMHCQLRGQDGG